MFLLSSFVSPIIKICLWSIIQRLTPGSWVFDVIADSISPSLLLPLEQVGVKYRLMNKFYNFFGKNNHANQNDDVGNSSVGFEESIGVEYVVDNPLMNRFQSDHHHRETLDIQLTSNIHNSNNDLEISVHGTSNNDPAILLESNFLQTQLQHKPPQKNKMKNPKEKIKRILPIYSWIPQLAQILCIIMSYGLIFPILAILGFIALASNLYFYRFSMQVFVQELQRNYEKSKTRNALVNKYRTTLDVDCLNMAILMRRCLGWTFPLGSVALGYFLFDIIGGIYPGQQEQYAAILPCVFLGAIGFFYAIRMLVMLHYSFV